MLGNWNDIAAALSERHRNRDLQLAANHILS
jgi:hypothetical protein